MGKPRRAKAGAFMLGKGDPRTVLVRAVRTKEKIAVLANMMIAIGALKKIDKSTQVAVILEKVCRGE